MKLKRQNYCVYQCLYHIVFVPKFRYKVLVEEVDKYLEIKFDEIKKHYPEIEFVERSIQPDHVHLLLSFPPKYSVSKIIGILKQNSGSALVKKFDFIKQRYIGLGSIWSSGYFVSTVGANEEQVRKYIQYQEKEDTGQAELEV